MNEEKKLILIDRQLVSDMLFGEEKYITEFANASIESFTQFQNHFIRFLKERDMENLRRAGHKIKPVALMLKVENLIEEYEQAKRLIEENRPDDDIEQSIQRVDSICRTIIEDFTQILTT